MSVIKPYLSQRPVISDLCNYVRTNRWYQLGIQLDIDTICLNDIQVEHHSEEKRRSRMFEEWLRVNPKASVGQLIEALRKESVQEYVIAYKIEKIYKSRYNELPQSITDKTITNETAVTAKYAVSTSVLVVLMSFAYMFWFIIVFMALSLQLASATIYRLLQNQLNSLLTRGVYTGKVKRRLDVKLDQQSSSTVMAVSKDVINKIDFNNLLQEEMFSLVVTILDRDSDKPVPMYVDIYEQGMELQPSTCYLTTSVITKRKKPNTDTKGKLYYLQIHENSIMDQAKLVFCFSEPNTEYNITIKIHSIVDDNGEEVTNDYRIKGETCSVLTFDQLIEFVAPLKGRKYHQLMETLTQLTLSGNSQKLIELTESMSKSTGMPYDFKPIVYISLGLSSLFNGDQPYEDSMMAFSHALELSTKCEYVNCCLIEGMVYIYMAQVNSHFQKHEKSYENTQKAKIKFFNVMPCHDISMVYFQEALLRLDKADFKLTAETKKKILSDIDMWAKHTKQNEDDRSLSLFSYSLTFKAEFHLNIFQPWLLQKNQTEIEVPQLTEEDLQEAKASLDAVPEEFLEKHKPSDYKVQYYFVLLEYYRLSGNTKLAHKST